MTSVMVFVDDAVRARFPDVCAKTGDPSDGTLTVSTAVGDGSRLGALWLLVLAGPLGWLVLVVLSLMRSGRGETLTIQLPFSEMAFAEQAEARRARRNALMGACLTGVMLVATLIVPLPTSTNGPPLGAVLVVVLVGGLVLEAAIAWRAGTVYRRWTVPFTLDASRRWVTLEGVDSRFAHLVSEQQAQAPTRP